MDFGFTAIAGISIICYLIAEAIKATALDSKWIPVICGAFGAILGIVGFCIIQDFPAANFIDAFAVGIASGLAATGANQIYKQLR